MKKSRFYVCQVLFLFLVSSGFAQRSTNIKMMYWNLLNYPSSSNTTSDSTLRHPFYREVIHYVEPDILVTGENTFSTSNTWFLNGVMNVNGNSYSKGAFINGFDTNNEIYFKTGEFIFLNNHAIRTDVRDINEYKLVHLLTGDTIRIYAVHLKASSGPPNDAQRAEEVDSLRKVTNQLPPGSNFMVCGDFNIYGDYEAAYQKLVLDNAGDDGNFVDPITMTGVWNRYSYRQFHTQSTRTTSFGGGATGGLNDRFDMILYSTAISQNTSGVSYVAGSTTPVGNDGNHFDDDINLMPNSAAPTSVVDALHNASDHLPVTALFAFSDPDGISSFESDPAQLTVYPNPSGGNFLVTFHIAKMQHVVLKITDVTGREVKIITSSLKQPGIYQYPVEEQLDGGAYFMNLLLEDGHSSNKIFVVNR